ncbi:hypothetical protein F7661_19685 [Pseudomonas sp. CFA]|nr:hypothetical protein F7661_19685 [Pseudomonas sp. CFA]
MGYPFVGAGLPANTCNAGAIHRVASFAGMPAHRCSAGFKVTRYLLEQACPLPQRACSQTRNCRNNCSSSSLNRPNATPASLD